MQDQKPGGACASCRYMVEWGQTLQRRADMEISQFFMNGDIKGAIAYMREHEEFKDILPAYVAIFENGEYRRFDVPDKLNEILLL